MRLNKIVDLDLATKTEVINKYIISSCLSDPEVTEIKLNYASLHFVFALMKACGIVSKHTINK